MQFFTFAFHPPTDTLYHIFIFVAKKLRQMKSDCQADELITISAKRLSNSYIVAAPRY